MTAVDETTFPTRLSEPDKPTDCPAWCAPGIHDLSLWADEKPFASREEYERAVDMLRVHRSDDESDALTYTLPVLTTWENPKVNDEPKVTRDSHAAFWTIHLLDASETQRVDVPLVAVHVQAAGKDGFWEAVRLPLTAPEALLFARQLVAAAEALQFNRTI